MVNALVVDTVVVLFHIGRDRIIIREEENLDDDNIMVLESCWWQPQERIWRLPRRTFNNTCSILLRGGDHRSFVFVCFCLNWEGEGDLAEKLYIYIYSGCSNDIIPYSSWCCLLLLLLLLHGGVIQIPNGWMDGWQRERERAAGGGRRASIGVACVSHPTRGCPTQKRPMSTGVQNQEENQPTNPPNTPDFFFRHANWWNVMFDLDSEPTTKCRGLFYAHFRNLSILRSSSSSHWNKNKTYGTYDV